MSKQNLNNLKQYSSKIILLGEYGVIQGGEILAVPISKFSAQWIKDKPSIDIQKELLKIYDYLIANNNNNINLKQLKEAIDNGVYLSSNIPSGYGLGSSGAITAAIYDEFAFEKTNNLDELKQNLIDVESCFHGVSSGIDPLVIYLNTSIHIDKDGINVLDKSIDLSHYFLIDTQTKRKTSPLVDQYIERANHSKYRREIDNYNSLNRKAIHAQLNKDYQSLSKLIAKISHWQYEYLDFAILENYKSLWQSTLNRSDISLKHCGAGGGGFIMGFAENVDAIATEFKNEFDIIKLA